MRNKPIVGEKYGSFRVLSGAKGLWKVKCELCGDIKNRTANALMGSPSVTQKRCWCEIGRVKWKMGSMVRGMSIIGPTDDRGRWLLRCKCGKEIRRKAVARAEGCGCGKVRYNPGDMLHGRRVVQHEKKKNGGVIVECLSCGSHAKVNPHLPKTKCRHCQGWDARMGAEGNIYAIICPYTGEAKYVGSTCDKSYRRVIGHFRERNSEEKKNKPLYQWLQMLANEGAMPGCILLESVKNDSVHQREIFWINKLKSEGCHLFNLLHIKEVQSCRG